jgi:hypothetical protein
MRRTPVALATGGLLALAACGRDSDTTSPRDISPQQRSSVVIGGSCDFRLMRADARAFFKTGSDPAFAAITAMENAYSSGGAAAATIYGWPILKVVAAERLTSAQGGTAEDGSRLVVDVFNCTTNTVPSDFLTVGTTIGTGVRALTGGIFEVRGSVATDPPARGYLSVSGARKLGRPVWGVQSTGTGWPTTQQFLIYGYPTRDANLVNATEININGPTPYPNGFELVRIPRVSVGTFLVGICVEAKNGGTVTLLVHDGVNQVNANPSSLCSVSATASNSTPSLMQRLASVFSPKLAFAQGLLLGVGGLPSDWSPNTTGNILASNVYLQFDPQQTDANIGDALGVRVLATDGSLTGPPVPGGVAVTLSIAGNNGTPAYFRNLTTNDSSATVTEVTDVTGHASFSNYTLTKAGGYTLSASASVGGLLPANGSITSPMFNIKNK